MAKSYAQISYGSQGDDVKELQTLLNNNGYSLDVDGIFGSDTQSAVRDYQKKNNLAVDGIVGTNTWGALTKTSTGSTAPGSSGSSSSGSSGKQDAGFKYDSYKQSDVVKQAEAMLQQQLANKPGAYQSQWQPQLDDTLQKILNREQFSYDLNGDALYQQYKDQYMLQGQQAMMDTIGQAAALTGGYGNSYAQTVGQQTYQGYLQQLNDRIPELYQLALSKYQMEGDALYDQAALMAQQEEQDYGRYRDQMSDYYTELDRLTEDARYQGELDYGKWSDGRDFAYGQFIDDRNLAYQQERDKVADEQWQAQFDEAVRQWNHANGISSGGSSTGSSSGNRYTGGNINNGSLKESQIKSMQYALGLTPDGKWGPNSQATAKKLWGVTSADDAWAKYQKNTSGRTQGNNTGGSENDGLSGGAFTTYNEAVAYIKANGGDTQGLMTQTEWQRHRNSYVTTGQSNAEGANYKTYSAYLTAFAEYATS